MKSKAARLRASRELVAEIDRWMKRIGPELPDISPDELHLHLWAILRRKYGGELRFLLRRKKGGGYVF
jgi:hypothetical protein